MTPSIVSVLFGVLAAGFYLPQVVAPAHPTRTLIKTVPLVCFCAAAVLGGAPAYMVAALGFSALGDLALALSGRTAFLYGLAAFGLAHCLYILLFLALSGVPVWEVYAVAPLPALALLALAISTELWLAPYTASLRWPVRLYVALITAMGLAALMLPTSLALMTLGAGLFILSDLILALQLFRLREGSVLYVPAGVALWVAYIAGQAMILMGALT